MTAIASLADVDICNMALSHLSISTTIVSLDPPGQSNAAQVCAFWYPKMRNWLLQSAPWNFAYVSAALTSDPTVFPGYSYAYQQPNDCLQPVAVTTFVGQRLGPQFWSNWWWPYQGMSWTVPKVPYKVVQSVQSGLAILTDISAPAYLFYIQCVTNTALMDQMFMDALSLYIAARAGGPLRANLQKVQACQQAAENMRLQALAQHLNAAQQDLERDSPSIQARW